MHKTPGCYVARVQVPASFLMPGIYTLSAHAFQMGDRDFNPLHLADDVIRFTVCETGTDVSKVQRSQECRRSLSQFSLDG